MCQYDLVVDSEQLLLQKEKHSPEQPFFVKVKVTKVTLEFNAILSPL